MHGTRDRGKVLFANFSRDAVAEVLGSESGMRSGELGRDPAVGVEGSKLSIYMQVM
jgi:hypothetical protein